MRQGINWTKYSLRCTDIQMLRANARAILARSLQVADMQVDAMDY